MKYPEFVALLESAGYVLNQARAVQGAFEFETESGYTSPLYGDRLSAWSAAYDHYCALEAAKGVKPALLAGAAESASLSQPEQDYLKVKNASGEGRRGMIAALCQNAGYSVVEFGDKFHWAHEEPGTPEGDLVALPELAWLSAFCHWTGKPFPRSVGEKPAAAPKVEGFRTFFNEALDLWYFHYLPMDVASTIGHETQEQAWEASQAWYDKHIAKFDFNAELEEFKEWKADYLRFHRISFDEKAGKFDSVKTQAEWERWQRSARRCATRGQRGSKRLTDWKARQRKKGMIEGVKQAIQAARETLTTPEEALDALLKTLKESVHE